MDLAPLTTVKVPAPLLEAALKGQAHRPLRVWCLVRSMDPSGRGRLRREAVLAGLEELGVRRSARFDWVDELLADGRFARANRATADGSDWIVLASLPSLLKAFHIRRSTSDVQFAIAPLLTDSYRRALLNAARAAHANQSLARATVQDRFGASKSTQRRAERDADARQQAHWRRYEVNQHTRDKLPVVDGKRVFLHGGALFERLPNSTHFPGITVSRRRRHSCDHGARESSVVDRQQRDREVRARGDRGRCEPGPRQKKLVQTDMIPVGRDWVAVWQEEV